MCSRYPSAKRPRVGLLVLAAPAELRGAGIANPSRLRDGDAEGYAKGVVVAMFVGTRWGGACFVGRDVFVSSDRGCSRAGRQQRQLRVPPLSVVACQVGGEGGWVGDVGIEDETIAVGDEIK